MSRPKARIGEGHLAALARLGLKELTHNILPAFPHQGQHVIEEPGLWGNPTQGEVATAREGPGAGPHQESHAPQKKYTLEEMRGMAKERKADHEKDHGKERQREQEHER